MRAQIMTGAIILVGAATGPTSHSEIRVEAQELRLSEPQTEEEAVNPAPMPEAVRVEESLEFLNGDKLRGRLTGIEADGTVQWSHPEAKAAIQFSPRHLARINLDPNAGRGKGGDGFMVRLVNGNELPGKIMSMDKDHLVLNTWFAGTLTIPRKHVVSFRPVRVGNLLYEGPVNMEEWTTGRVGQGRGWRFRDGALVSSRPGLIGRDMKLPDVAKIDFDLAWTGNLGLLISLYAPNVESYSSNCYLLQMNAGYIYLNRSSNRGGQNNLGQTQVEELARRNKAKVGLRINKEQKTVALLLDGVMVKQWRDPGEFAGAGGGLAFYAQGQGSIVISRLQVAEWDGRMDDTGPTDASGTEQDSISLVNRDKVSGTIQKIEDGQLHLTSAFAPLTIPLERLDRVELAGASSEGIKDDDSMVRIGLPNDGVIVVKLERMNRERAAVLSPSFGKAEFNPQAFRHIDFNLKRERAKSDGELGVEEEVVEE